jgi:hypothetical protein
MGTQAAFDESSLPPVGLGASAWENVVHVSYYAISSYVVHFKEHSALMLRNLLKIQSKESHKNQELGLCQDSCPRTVLRTQTLS